MEPTQHDVHVPPRSSARGADAPRRGRGRRGESSGVSAIARAAGRRCSRPGCQTPAAATLVFSYSEQVARLVDLLEQGEPQAYDLCPVHADRTGPPVGWKLSDTRPPPSDRPRRLEDDETVAVLAAALRGETPPTRVSVVEGGRVDEPAADGADDHTAAEEDVADAQDPSAPAAHVAVDEDPLRAALEELQRVAMPDDDVTGAASATPLRRETTVHHRAAAPDEPPSPQPLDDAPVQAVWDEVVAAREASGETDGDDLTLW